MFFFKKKESWQSEEKEALDEALYLRRREFLKLAGIGSAIGLSTALTGRGIWEDKIIPGKLINGVHLNPKFTDVGRPLTDENEVYSYNNFYEFSTEKTKVRRVAKDFKIEPYQLRIDGLVDKEITLDLDDIKELELEQRIYRHRCVEAWAMTVPWLGVPLHKILSKAGIKSEAKYLKIESFNDPKQAPGQRNDYFIWPYYEALTIAEAMNELSFVSIGLYGKELLPQNGAPLRIVLPWKYGFKGPKSVVRITAVKEKPGTFWNDQDPEVYSFFGNVRPDIAHPRWSQKRETLLGSGDKIDTLLYNGYGDFVAKLYGKNDA